jgi:phospholipid transport system substrate-binding protein
MTKPLSPAAPLRAFALALALAGTPVIAQAATPTTAQAPLSDPAAKQIRAFYDVLLDSMKHAKALGIEGRYKKLEPAIDAAFDFPDMTKMTVGPQWQSMSKADKTALTDAFRRLTIADYAHNFDGYGGEHFIVDPKVVERAGDKLVSSKMTQPGKEAIPFVYRMTKTAKGWQIVDIFLNGYVSEVATRRADFASTLKKGGAKALAAKLNAMTDKTLKGQ